MIFACLTISKIYTFNARDLARVFYFGDQ